MQQKSRTNQEWSDNLLPLQGIMAILGFLAVQLNHCIIQRLQPSRVTPHFSLESVEKRRSGGKEQHIAGVHHPWERRRKFSREPYPKSRSAPCPPHAAAAFAVHFSSLRGAHRRGHRVRAGRHREDSQPRPATHRVPGRMVRKLLLGSSRWKWTQ